MAKSSAFGYSVLPDTAQSLYDYMGPTSFTHTITLPEHESAEAIEQMMTDMQRAQMHADIYEEAAVNARKKALWLQSTVNFYKNMSVPLVRMPTEILTLVFQRCVLDDTAGHVFSHRATPVVLSHTCRRWRAVALSIPSLWNLIRLHIERSKKYTSLDMLRVWLERSQPLPISCLAQIYDHAMLSTNKDVLDHLILHSSRWAAMEFCVGSQVDLCIRLYNMNRHLPQLQYIHVEAQGSTTYGGGGGWSEDCLTTWTAPKLKEGTLVVLGPVDTSRLSIALPWAQLEQLEWTAGMVEFFFYVAHEFSNLRRCSIHVSAGPERDSFQQIALPRLRHLEVSGPYQGIIAILDALSAPSLQRLDVDPEEQIGSVANSLLSSIGQLQRRSSCQIFALSAPCTLFTSSSTPSLAREISTVEELRLLLTAEEDNSQAASHLRTIFRSLKTLRFLYRELPGLDSSLFSMMAGIVEIRRHPVSHSVRLERLSIDVLGTDSSPDTHISTESRAFQELLKLREDGLDIQGSVVAGKWHSYYGGIRWCKEDLQRSVRRWARFGYSDWLYEPELDAFLKVSTIYKFETAATDQTLL
ncbi:hypothetical protein VNI00_007067 [Paramarasmius palmivorus]|uniref:F-box domain-containing protein n=1 Tax=Paramarasmius palmivorus TaxID=297713 RepID=A0AAW0BKM7_9AGAR